MTGVRHDAPSAWIARFATLVPSGATVLDVAAGRGRHARFFAQRGAQVVAVDIDAAALADLADVAGITVRVADLEGATWPFADATFDAIIVTNYLHRPLLAHLLAALKADGVLLYETFATGNERFGRPSNPAFLLREGELLDVVRERLSVVAFEQGRVEQGGVEQGRLQQGRVAQGGIEHAHAAVVQRIAAAGRARQWPPVLPVWNG